MAFISTEYVLMKHNITSYNEMEKAHNEMRRAHKK